MGGTHNDPDAPVVLALDTAGAACAVAVCRGSRTLATDRQAMRHGHAAAVMPMIEHVLATAGLTFAAIDRYVVNRGPGGFTGLRVGLAAIGGLALATDRPIVGIDGFDVLAHQARTMPHAATRDPRPLIAAIDSRRSDPYVQAYDPSGQRRDGPYCLTMEALTGFLRRAAGDGGTLSVIGDGAHIVASAGNGLDIDRLDVAGRDPVTLAQLGLLAEGDRQPPPPLYIRPVDAMPAPTPRGLTT